MSYKETHAAIEEAKTPKDLPEVDTSSVDSMMLSMGDGNRQHFKRSLLSVGKVLLAICIGLCICWLLSGCSPKIVEVEKPVIVEQTHTQHHTDIVRDTLVWRDSVYHFVKGDTFRGALQICFYRFVCRGGEIDDCVIHNLLCHCKSDTLYLVPLAAGEVRHNYRHGAMVDGNLGKFYE